MPPDEKPDAGSADDWLRHAQSDLRAGAVLSADPHVMREQACFHYQQAAEKALKAVLVKRGIDFPRTHDLAQLIALLVTNRIAVPAAVRYAESLTPYAVQTRYPGDMSEIFDAELSEAQSAATAVVSWAQTRIAPTPTHGVAAKRRGAR